MSAPTAADRLNGEQIMGDGEPTAQDAAELVRALMAAGTVARLDLMHGALTAAFRAGQAAERAESDRLAAEAAERFARDAQGLAAEHAAAFAARHLERARLQAERDARPWCQQ